MISEIVSIFKPNRTSLGYALFLAVNAAGVWGGVFPFLTASLQTPELLFWFFLAHAIVFSLTYFASAFGSYFFPRATRSFLVKIAAAPYFAGWTCLIAAMYFDGLRLLLLVCSGAMLGLGTAGFFMLWQRIFAGQDPDAGSRDLILGTAYASIIYFALHLIPRAITSLLIPLLFLPLFSLAVLLKSRQIDLRQAMFEDVPREHPQVYRRVIVDYWRSAFCIGALGFCTGIVRALAVDNPDVGLLVNIMSMAASLAAAIVFLLLWRSKTVHLNVPAIYRVFFPFIITSFLLLPFASVAYDQGVAAALYAVYSIAITVMMMQCAQASQDRGVNPIFVYGFFGGIVYLLHGIGFLSGSLSEHIGGLGIDPLTAAAFFSVYLLGLIYFVGQGGFSRIVKQSKADPRLAAEEIEFIALQPQSSMAERRARRGGANDGGAGAGSTYEGFDDSTNGAANPRTNAVRTTAAGGTDARSENAAGKAAVPQPGGMGAAANRGAGARSANVGFGSEADGKPARSNSGESEARRTNSAAMDGSHREAEEFEIAGIAAAGVEAAEVEAAGVAGIATNGLASSKSDAGVSASRNDGLSAIGFPSSNTHSHFDENPEGQKTRKAQKSASRNLDADGPMGASYQDRISKQAAMLRQAYRLSARETEVMEHIARGKTVARIAEELVVSENTIRTHTKRIYAKLDIHKKQELLDLVDSFDPRELAD